MNNLINITSIGGCFIVVGRGARAFFDNCFIELQQCNIFIGTYLPNGAEHAEISNCNIITNVSVSNPILETISVNISDSHGEMTFVDILQEFIPSCHYSIHECTCEFSLILFNYFQFFLVIIVM